MTSMRTVFVLAALMIGFSLPTLAAKAAEHGTPQECKALVAKAIAAFKEKGPAVFSEMRAGSFRDRDLYVFVSIGSPWLEDKATPEGVWVDYRWKHPQTGKVADKSSWVVRSGDYIFGCGVHK